MKKPRVFHLVYYGYEKTVVDAQVVAPAKRLAADGVDVELVFLEDPIPWLLGRWREKKKALSAAGLKSHFLPRVPRNFLGLNSRRLSSLFSRFLNEGSPIVVHARGFQGAESVLPLKRRRPELRLICDARGIESAEYEMSVTTSRERPMNVIESRWMRSLEQIERRAVYASDTVFCVSRAMIPFLKERAGRRDGPFEFVPCAVDVDSFAHQISEREKARQELSLGSGPVMVYAGSMAAWQAPEESAAVAARFLKKEAEGRFLVITPTPEEFRTLAIRNGVPPERLRVIKVAHHDIARYLAAADIALLLREENVVNRYACPTKFAEYLACGLHVLATSAVEEVASTIRDANCGTLIKTLGDRSGIDSAIAAAVSASRDVPGRTHASVQAARDRYDWGRHLPTLKKWYLQLASLEAIPK